MLICEKCHTERQARTAQESQPLQWTGYETRLTRMNCPDCGHKAAGMYREYLNAYELACELGEAKERLEKMTLPGSFPVMGYHSAADMLERSRIFPAILQDPESMQAVLGYAAEIEEVLDHD